MSSLGEGQQIDFSVDKNNLYREEGITDLKVASIRQMIPIRPDGTDDPERKPIFVAHTQLMSPEGPLPLQAKLDAENLSDAMNEFPGAMKKALAEMIEQLQELKRQQQSQQRDSSRIIVPGR